MKKEKTFRDDTWGRLKKNKPAFISLYILFVMTFIALAASLLANEKPLYAKYKGTNIFPALSVNNSVEISNASTGEKEILQYDIADWKNIPFEKVIWCPVVFSPGKSDLANGSYLSPCEKGNAVYANNKSAAVRFSHLLGTTKTGADVLSGLIHGTRVSLSIGIFSMLIAGLIGIILGSLAGFTGDYSVKFSRGELWLLLLGLFPAYFYAFVAGAHSTHVAVSPSAFVQLCSAIFSGCIFIIVIIIFFLIGRIANRISFLSKQIYFPVDNFILRFIEIFNSIPRIILIITLAAVSRPSITNLILIIGLTSWTDIARLVRAEMLRIRNSDYISAATAHGLSNYRIILKHALPNAMASALVAIAFGISSAILLESGLSFLGIGVPHNIVTWGSLLFQGKENFEAWWLVLFPGIAIFITVTSLNLLGDGLRDAMDVKSR